MAGRAELNQGLAILTGGPLSSLRSRRLAAATADFRAAEKSFASARARLGPWGELATRWGGVLPGRASEVQAAAPLLDLAQQTAGAAASLGDGLRPLVSLTGDASPAAAGRSTGPAAGDGRLVQLTAVLEQAQPALARAQQQLAAARRARRRPVGMPLPAGVAPLLSRFDQHEATLALALTYARGLPALLGAQGPRSYLLVYQDTADLRATGGYIGSASAITLDHGRLSQVDYEDSKQLQVPRSRSISAPEPMFYYEGYSSLELRDTNYWPDFPTSARQIAHIYQTITGRHLDGVVAVQP